MDRLNILSDERNRIILERETVDGRRLARFVLPDPGPLSLDYECPDTDCMVCDGDGVHPASSIGIMHDLMVQWCAAWTRATITTPPRGYRLRRMPKLTMAWHGEDHPPPKRGDTLAFPKTRYVVLGVRRVKRRDPGAGPKYVVWCFREAQVDAPLHVRLWQSAERAGGAIEHACTWDPRNRKR